MFEHSGQSFPRLDIWETSGMRCHYVSGLLPHSIEILGKKGPAPTKPCKDGMVFRVLPVVELRVPAHGEKNFLAL